VGSYKFSKTKETLTKSLWKIQFQKLDFNSWDYERENSETCLGTLCLNRGSNWFVVHTHNPPTILAACQPEEGPCTIKDLKDFCLPLSLSLPTHLFDSTCFYCNFMSFNQKEEKGPEQNSGLLLDLFVK